MFNFPKPGRLQGGYEQEEEGAEHPPHASGKCEPDSASHPDVVQHIYTHVEVDEDEEEEEKEREHFRMRARSLEDALLRSSWFKDRRARRSRFLSAAQVGAFLLLLALWRSGRLHQLISRIRSAHQFFPPSHILSGKMGV